MTTNSKKNIELVRGLETKIISAMASTAYEYVLSKCATHEVIQIGAVLLNVQRNILNSPEARKYRNTWKSVRCNIVYLKIVQHLNGKTATEELAREIITTTYDGGKNEIAS